MASIPTSVSVHHSINTTDPRITNRVHLNCEEAKKPYCASSLRHSQTDEESQRPVLLPDPPHPQIPPISHNALSRASTPLPTWRHLDRTGLYFIPGTLLRMLSWPPLNAKMIAAVHQQYQVGARLGSLLGNTLHTAGRQ